MQRLLIPAMFLSMSFACGGGDGPMEADEGAAVQAPAQTKAPADKAPEAHGDHAGHDHAKEGASEKVEVAFTPLDNASVAFASPADGATVRSPVKVVFSVEGATVKAAGVPEAGTGHHHVIVDGTPVESGMAVPADETHIHYGKGQTEAEIALSPGEHTLTLQFADGLHRSYGPALTNTITVNVTE